MAALNAVLRPIVKDIYIIYIYWALLPVLTNLLLMTSCLQLLSSLPQLLMLLPASSALEFEGFL